MATVESVRTLIATFDAYEDEDFDRLAELYAEDVTWTGAEPGQRDCQTREDVFRMFRARMNSGELRPGPQRGVPCTACRPPGTGSLRERLHG